MANTHDYDIENNTGQLVRQDLNNLFAEIQASNIGGSAPTQAVTGKIWYDSTNAILKVYDGSAWVAVSSVIKDSASGSGVKDEDNMVSDSATHLASQQSIKAYVDSAASQATTAAQAVGTGDSPTFAGATVNGNVVLSSGSGIDFSATADSSGTMTSELLDDYEEGTWTPQWVSTSATFSHTERIGLYTKIGRVVHISIHITLGSIPTGTLNNALYIETLPFTSSATYMGGISIGAYNNFNYPSTEYVGDQFMGRINNSATVIEMKMVEDNGSIVNVLCNAITGGATFHASATYFV